MYYITVTDAANSKERGHGSINGYTKISDVVVREIL